MFANKTTKCIVFNGDDENSHKAVDGVDKEKITFGFDRKNDYMELLLTISFTDKDGVLWHLVHDIPEILSLNIPRPLDKQHRMEYNMHIVNDCRSDKYIPFLSS